MEDLSFISVHDEQFSANGFFSCDQGLDNLIKMSPSEMIDFNDGFEICDWNDHVGFGKNSPCDDFDFKCNLDFNTDLFDDTEGSILNNAFTHPTTSKTEPGLTKPTIDKEKILFPGDVEPLRVSSSIQTDSVLKRITQARSVLIHGEKEIFGKNIVGLYSLNEIKSSPEENCQITSTVINGKRYKIIIRPKSTPRIEPQAKKSDGGVSDATAIKLEPVDEVISELQNGDYNVLGDEMTDSWHLPLDEGSNSCLQDPDLKDSPDNDLANNFFASKFSDEPRVPPLRIKIPKKMKKHKTKRDSLEADSMTGLTGKTENNERRSGGPFLLQPIPPSCDIKHGNRMLEAATAINRNKLLNIVSNGDAIQLDHDYCSYMLRQDNSEQTKTCSKLQEKNPRKDSGLESGGVSDASEECHTPETSQTLPLLAPQLRNKLLEERRRGKDHQHVTKMAAAFFRATNAITSGHKKVEAMSKPGAILLCDNKTSSDTLESNLLLDATTQERPKKKLKLEEYRSRRSDRDKEQISVSNGHVENCKIEPDQIAFPSADACEKSSISEAVPVDTLQGSESKEDVSLSSIPIVLNPSAPVIDSSPKRRIVRDTDRRTSRRRQRSSSSSASSRSSSRRRRERSSSRDGRRSSRSPSRRSSSGDSSSSSSSPNRRRSYSSLRHHRRIRSRSRSVSREKSWSRNRCFSNKRRSWPNRGRQSITRSKSPVYTQREKMKQIEERRVIYVGRIAEGTTNNQLRQRFSLFGPIVDISVHFRERGDNYGFVTFAYKSDAYEAVEHGNDDITLPHYDLCFGGRRSFCKQRYSDLDGMPTSYSGFKDIPPLARSESVDFDLLLKQAKEKLRKRQDSS